MKNQSITRLRCIFRASLMLMILVWVAVLGMSFSPFQRQAANAAVSSNVNFQARLMTNSGAIVGDGTYNVEFKLYSALSSSGSSQGSCTGDAACLWTETRTSSNKVTVANGYLTVELGSVTALPTTIDWSQNIYLSMRIGGTAVSPTWDPEMSPRLHLTAIPYAFSAGKLAATNGANTVTLEFATPSASHKITIPDSAVDATLCLQGSASCGFVSGAAADYIQNQTAIDQTASLRINGTGQFGTSVTSPVINATTSVQTAGTVRIDASGNLSNIGTISASGAITTGAGNITTNNGNLVSTAGGLSVTGSVASTGGALQISGTGSSYIMGSLGIGLVNPQGALSILNGAWITGQAASGSAAINMFQVNGNNEIQVGAPLSIDGGIILPTNAGQLTLVDLPIDATAASGTKQSYTFRVGTTNLLTVYGEANGSGGLQNGRIAVGTSITPAYTLDVDGDANLSSGSSFRINGTAICTISGCTPVSGNANYIQNQNSGQQNTSNFWISGNGRAGTALQAPLLDTATSANLNIGTTNANYINLSKSTGVSGTLTVTSQTAGASAGIIVGAANATVPVLIVKNGPTPGVSADILQIQDASGAVMFGVDNDGDTAVARSLRINYTAGVANGFTMQGASSSDFVTANALNSRFWIGDPAYCSGRFCVSQEMASGGGSSYTNSYNTMPVSVTSASTFINQDIVIADTSSGVSNTLRGIRIDLSGTTNSSATLHGLYIKIPSTTTGGAYGGNIIQLQNGSTNLMKMTNTGTTSFQNTANVAKAFQVLNAASQPVLNVDTTNKRVGVATENADHALTVNGDFNIRDADTATKQYRSRTSGSALDLEAAGADLYVSGYANADFTGTQTYWFKGSVTQRLINVGLGTGGANPTLIVLDKKDDAATDPSNGIDGAMYYNASMKGFRCYEDGAWRYCNDPRSMAYGFNIREEFVGVDVSAYTGSDLGWNEVDSGTNSDAYRIASQARRPGIIQLNTGSTSTGRSAYFLGYAQSDPSSATVSLGGGEVVEFAMNMDTLSASGQEFITRVGLCDNYSGDCTDGAYFEYDRTTSTNWRVATASGSSRSKLSTSTAVATGWNRFKMVVNSDASQIDFYVNDSLIGSRTANIPTGSALTDPMFHILKSSGTSSRNIQVDYFNMYSSFATPR